MPETVQQYIDRMLSNVGEDDPWRILESTPGRLRDLTRGQSHDVLARKAAPDRWSVVEIVAHLADSEVVGGWRFRSILASDALPIQAYDQNAWATAFGYASVPLEESLEAFAVARRATLGVLRRVDRVRYAHYGMHAERGRESVDHLLRLYAGHDVNHVRQIERLLA